MHTEQKGKFKLITSLILLLLQFRVHEQEKKWFPFQFECTNTLNDQLLEDVRVEVDPPGGFFVQVWTGSRSSCVYLTTSPTTYNDLSTLKSCPL